MSNSVEAKKQQLKQLYSTPKRVQEMMGVVAGLCLCLANYYFIFKLIIQNKCSMLRLAVYSTIGVLGADLCSGVVHWACDTWGSITMPLLGKNILRPFREHHIAPTRMCEHDFIETNGDNFSICLISLAYMFSRLMWDEQVLHELQLQLAILFFLTYIMFTNQIHKWSHQYDCNWFVRSLQSSWLILPPRHHKVHHSYEHESHYCITTGWMNEPLEAIRFWRLLEKAISAVTGAKPRGEDQFYRAPSEQ